MSEEEPKIFIDEGWKAQVQREKEEAARKAAAGEPETPEAAPEDTSPPEPAGENPEPEPASFTTLVGSLATQTMFTLGLIADPESGQVMVNLEAARYTLDLLDMLKEKTAGNLTPEETESINQACEELEQAYGVRVRQFEEQAARQAGAGVDLDNLKGD